MAYSKQGNQKIWNKKKLGILQLRHKIIRKTWNLNWNTEKPRILNYFLGLQTNLQKSGITELKKNWKTLNLKLFLHLIYENFSKIPKIYYKDRLFLSYHIMLLIKKKHI